MISNHVARLISNPKKLSEVMDTFDITFLRSDSLHNVVSKAVLPDALADEILQNDVIGTEHYETFVRGRFHGDLPAWTPFRKKAFKALQE